MIDFLMNLPRILDGLFVLLAIILIGIGLFLFLILAIKENFLKRKQNDKQVK